MQASGWYTSGKDGRKEPVAIHLNKKKGQLQASGVKRHFSVRWTCSDIYLARQEINKTKVVQVRHYKYRRDCLHVTDTRLVEQLQQFEPFVGKSNYFRERRWRVGALAVLLSMLMVITLLFYSQPIASGLVGLAPDSWHRKLENQLNDALDQQFKACVDQDAQRLLQRRLDAMSTSSGRSVFPEIILFKSDRAFVLPFPGRLAISTSYLNYLGFQQQLLVDMAEGLAMLDIDIYRNITLQRSSLPYILHSVLFNNVDHIVAKQKEIGLASMTQSNQLRVKSAAQKILFESGYIENGAVQLQKNTLPRFDFTRQEIFAPGEWSRITSACRE